jgi:hypothetical protein
MAIGMRRHIPAVSRQNKADGLNDIGLIFYQKNSLAHADLPVAEARVGIFL